MVEQNRLAERSIPGMNSRGARFAEVEHAEDCLLYTSDAADE